MTHCDDDGLIIPTKLATNQVVVVPIYRKDEDKDRVLDAAAKIRDDLKAEGYGVILDDRDQHKPGFKYAEWELKGIPIRIEIGPRDLDSGSCVLATRHDRAKETVEMGKLPEAVEANLERMQKDLLQRALDFRAANTRTIDSYDEFKELMKGDGGFVWAHWNGSERFILSRRSGGHLNNPGPGSLSSSGQWPYSLLFPGWCSTAGPCVPGTVHSISTREIILIHVLFC